MGKRGSKLRCKRSKVSWRVKNNQAYGICTVVGIKWTKLLNDIFGVQQVIKQLQVQWLMNDNSRKCVVLYSGVNNIFHYSPIFREGLTIFGGSGEEFKFLFINIIYSGKCLSFYWAKVSYHFMKYSPLSLFPPWKYSKTQTEGNTTFLFDAQARSNILKFFGDQPPIQKSTWCHKNNVQVQKFGL